MPKMNMDDFPQQPVLLDDRYSAKLKEVTEYEKIYEGEKVQKLAWVFEVKADEEAIDDTVEYDADEATGVYEIAAHTSFATGPNSNFTKLNFPAFVGEDWSGDTDDVIGKSCIVDVTSYETKGGQTRNVIEKIRVEKKKKAASGKAIPNRESAEEANLSDFSDLPF